MFFLCRSKVSLLEYSPTLGYSTCLQKQSCKKDDGSVHEMPKEEVEKLRSYYADIDAFELQEEEVSDNEREEK